MRLHSQGTWDPSSPTLPASRAPLPSPASLCSMFLHLPAVEIPCKLNDCVVSLALRVHHNDTGRIHCGSGLIQSGRGKLCPLTTGRVWDPGGGGRLSLICQYVCVCVAGATRSLRAVLVRVKRRIWTASIIVVNSNENALYINWV